MLVLFERQAIVNWGRFYLLLSLDRNSANILTAWSSAEELALMSSRTTPYFLWEYTEKLTVQGVDKAYFHKNKLTMSLWMAKQNQLVADFYLSRLTWAMYALYKNMSLSISFSGDDGLNKNWRLKWQSHSGKMFGEIINTNISSFISIAAVSQTKTST